MLPLSRVDGRGLLIAPLARRNKHYTASSTDATTRSSQQSAVSQPSAISHQLSAVSPVAKWLMADGYFSGCQPAGVGRLKVRLAWVERATTILTGSV